jgi:hypothetical protein
MIAIPKKHRSVFLAIFIMFGFIVLFYGPGMPNIAKLQSICTEYHLPDATFGYNEAQLRATFECMGSKGMDIYERIQVIDMFFPFAYVYMFFVLLTKSGLHKRLSMAIPSVAGASDYIENIIIWNQRTSFPDLNASLISVANVFTYLKFSFILLCVMIVLFRFLTIAYKWYKELP